MNALYLYPLWLRLWHWTNAVLFIVLILSGVSMHFAGASWLMSFETARPIHNTAGILLTIGWIGFVVGNLLTANGHHYRVRLRGLPSALFAQMRYYAWGIFRNEPHPFHPSEAMKLNALQQLSYIGAMYLLMPALILSGWAFIYVFLLPETLFGIGTVWIVAMTHVLVSYLLVLFLLVHVYIMTTGDTPLSNLKAMVSGWHERTDH